MNETNDIELNMETLSRNSGTYTSLTDLYSVHIFTDADMQKFEAKEKEESSYYNHANQLIFLGKKQKEKFVIQDTLFLDEISFSKKQEVLDNASKANEGVLFIVILAAIVFVLGMIRYNIYRAIRRKNNADNSNIYQ